MNERLESQGDAKQRWRVGHHAFLVLIQGIILSLVSFERAIDAGALPEAALALRRGATLLRGARAAFCFGSDFDRDTYEEIVRPSMASAHPRFSGLMNSDHRALIDRLRRLEPLFRNIPESLAKEHEEFAIAKRDCIAAHIRVCEVFQREGRSLRMSEKSKTPAIEVLTHLGNQRLGLLSYPPLVLERSAAPKAEKNK